MSRVQIDISGGDRIAVRFRPDLNPERGGTGFVDIGVAAFLIDGGRLAELRDAISHALDNPVIVPPGGDPS